jgi:citrate synthase
MPTPTETTIVDAVMVALMEHGLTPSAIAARLTYGGAPESLQGAIAAGILGAGGALLGTLVNCAKLLDRIVRSGQPVEVAATKEAEDHFKSGTPIPGFGHPHHKPHDPRTIRLFELARSVGVPGRHIRACEVLSEAVDRVYGKHLTVNASAACGALMMEIEMPLDVVRGFAVTTRAAGLVAHLHEEIQRPTLWEGVKKYNDAVPYRE